MQRTFTFNRPVIALYFLPLLAMLVFLVMGFIREQNFFVLVIILVTLAMLIPTIYLSFFRRLRINEREAQWITPRNQFQFDLTEVKHYGIVKFRSFRFIYLSRSETPPFDAEDSRVISNPDTFVIQFRKKAYFFIEDRIHAIHPELEPRAYRKE